ncbi:hypothetical protein E2C01_086866 [Portunus trituberculatus]|uniref:Uncharacterized protein n=1 Tax=Portunus trituberculatus TaxID=210409 RepID=A0A5B7JCK1_PORTR|nr:hypothetical protein [Portunus trituberculatus]
MRPVTWVMGSPDLEGADQTSIPPDPHLMPSAILCSGSLVLSQCLHDAPGPGLSPVSRRGERPNFPHALSRRKLPRLTRRQSCKGKGPHFICFEAREPLMWHDSRFSQVRMVLRCQRRRRRRWCGNWWRGAAGEGVHNSKLWQDLITPFITTSAAECGGKTDLEEGLPTE